MMILIKENIIKLFLQDTHICAVQGLQLMKYQIEKHKWSNDQWNEYYKIYRDFINSESTKVTSVINLTNKQVKELQNVLHDIIQNIGANMEVLGNEDISNYFIQPIMNCATDMSDKVFIQTKDTINEIKL